MSEIVDIELKPATFHHDGDDRDYIGFIADDLAEADPRLGVFNDDGGVENYDHRGVLAILAAKVNRLEEQVDGLISGVS